MSVRELVLPDALFQRYADYGWACGESMDAKAHSNPPGTTADPNAVGSADCSCLHAHPNMDTCPDCDCIACPCIHAGTEPNRYPSGGHRPDHDRDADAWAAMGQGSDVHPADWDWTSGGQPDARGAGTQVSRDDRGNAVKDDLVEYLASRRVVGDYA